MLTGVEVRNAAGSLVLTLPVAMATSNDPYVITDITGIGPVKADIITSTYASQDGVLFQDSRTTERNIVMSVGYRPDHLSNGTVQSLRRELYSYFPPEGLVNLRFLNDDYSTVEIVGYVESHEPKIFVKEPEVQISIICPDPFFKALKPKQLSSFNNLYVTPSYLGSAQSGFLFELFVNRPCTIVTLQNDLQGPIAYNGSLVSGDILAISTVRGDKYVRLTRGGVTTSDLDNLEGSLSMVINSSVARIRGTVAGSSDIPYRFTFTPKYIGI